MMKRISIFLLLLMACNPKQENGEKDSLANQAYEFPFLNPTLETEERVADLIGRMTVEEKLLQLFNEAPAIERLKVPAYNWWNESLHGVARAGKATVFPQAIGLAATFDETLMHQIATAISDEGRAKHHYFKRNGVSSIYTGLTFWSPNINIFRDPRWGRGQETYGEDPYLTGRMAVNFIRGLQGEDPNFFKTIATAKHYGVHSGPEVTRHTDNYFVNDRDLHETYLPAFKAAVQEGGVQSIMCAYNRFRDQPCCGSDLLLGRILREEFGFDGYVVTDCGAVTDFYKEDHHNLVERPSQAWGWAIAAGTDLNCEENKEFIADNLEEALEKGILNEADINRALTRLFKARFKLGMFDAEENVPYTDIPMSVVGSQTHQELALTAAEKSLVLLKNNGILPLQKNKKVAVIGPNADNLDVLVGNYNGTPVNPQTPLSGLKEYLGENQVGYSPGGPLVPRIYGNLAPVSANNFFHEEDGELKPGLKARYYNGPDFEGEPELERVDPNINFQWETSPINGQLEHIFSVVWSGVFKPEHTGKYIFNGTADLTLDGQVILDQKFGYIEYEEIYLEAGKSYQLESRYIEKPHWWAHTLYPEATLLWVDTSVDYVKEALNVAHESDVIVFCGGISPRLEGEEMKLDIDGFAHGDRTHLNLPANQLEILKALKATGKPVVFVNFSGSAMALNWENDNLDGIVQAFYPGERTGDALARLLFGDFSPSGRLPVTFYKSLEGLPAFNDYSMDNRTYKFFSGEVLYPFGHGLDYVSFEYDILNAPASLEAGDTYSFEVQVTNKGDMAADANLQVYLTDMASDVRVPQKALVSFQSIPLKANEAKHVECTITPEQMAVINKDYLKEVQDGDFMIRVLGSTGENSASASIKIKVNGNSVLK